MKKVFYLFVLSLFATISLSSCMDDVEYKSKYDAYFNAEFGKIDPTHTWGFGNNTSTRGVNVNGNLWYQNWVRPKNVTNDEITKVVAEFSKKRENAVATEDITWSNYWVQQVYCGNNNYKDGNESIVNTTEKMTELKAYNANAVIEEYWPERKTVYGGYEHVNNFNKSTNTTVYTDDVTKEEFIGTTLMVDMAMDKEHSGKQFSYQNTCDASQHFEYIILKIDGSYYVGFDFYAVPPKGQEANKNMSVSRDWIFNDWIIKVSPAKSVNESEQVADFRIICEDLGGSNDFDFNDVVFDVTYIDGKTKFTVLAAGGVYPLYIEGIEVHELLGVEQGKITNTFSYNEVQPQSFTVDKIVEKNDIKIYVNNGHATYVIEPVVGSAPKMICVDPSYEWTTEYERIDSKYPKFSEYVSNQNIIWY